MITELGAGAAVSAIALATTKACDFGSSIRNWILSLSRFVYHSGHPLWDDDQRFKRVTQEYRSFAFAFLGFLGKLTLVVAVAFSTIAATTMLVEAIGGPAEGDTDAAGFSRLFMPSYLLRWPFIVGTLLPILFFSLQLRRPSHDLDEKPEPYSVMDKFLHYVFLGNSRIATGLLRIECFLYRRQLRETKPRAHAYVSGLARSGSTSLMQYLAQLPGYRSLSYRNMPFIFSPRIGLRLASNDAGKEQERMHKDGMKHNLDTQEALEEPFWLHYCGRDYVNDERLVRHQVSAKVHERYLKFRSLIAGDQVYLAKNNNHLLRADFIHDLDAQRGLVTRTIIPFRDPQTQAESLLRQHVILSEMQQSNDFILDYMDLLGHYEFGVHVKTLTLESEASVMLSQQDPKTVDYWLEVWDLFYKRAYELYYGNPEFCFFCYESYLHDPEASLKRLLDFLEVDDEALKSIAIDKWRDESRATPSEVAEKYQITYSKMAEAAING